MNKNDKFNILEPFDGLFTQGMVCHETYKDENNNWLNPDEVTTLNGNTVLKNDTTKIVKVGPSESMSKSKKNTIDPEKIINNYGADSVRLFILSDSPPEKDVQWSEQGIASSLKFIQKLWTLNLIFTEEINKNNKEDVGDELVKFTNKFIKKVTDDLENFHYNVIIASMHQMCSYLSKEIKKGYKKTTLIENYKKILIVINPVLPHFSNECLEMIGNKTEIDWPNYDSKFLEEDTVSIVIQINGKKRGLINTAKDTDENNIFDQINNDEKLSKYVEKTKIKKRIYVKNKIMNLII